MQKKIGLVLTGGGARGAYQVGVLKRVSEINSRLGIHNPFSIISGISVGAINSALIASYAESISLACSKLEGIWSRLNTSNIIHTDKLSVGKKTTRMLFELISGTMIKQKKARSLLDNEPLSQLLSKEINFFQIHKNIQKGYLESLVVTAVNYADGKNTIFFESSKKIEPWVRERRVVIETEITKEHLLASSAIPLYFPPQKIGDHYFGDGNIRNSTPLSSPIRLGAEKLFVISVKEKETATNVQESYSPSLGRMISIILDSLLMDAVDFDFERLSRINETLKFVPAGENYPLKPIDVCMMRPSEDIVEISNDYLDVLPGTLRFFLEGLGSAKESGGLTSTLLFEPPFIRKLIELGYNDAKDQEEEIVRFFTD